MSFTTKALQPLAWAVLSHVSPLDYLSTGLKLTPGILRQRMLGVHPMSCVYPLCSGYDLKWGKETQPEMLVPDWMIALQEQLKTG